MIRKIKLAIGNLAVRFIKFTARKAKIDLIRLAYWENGILKSHNIQASGELFFIQTFLKRHIKSENPVLFDVGANLGDYSQLLSTNFHNAKIHTFEPNPNTFKLLAAKQIANATVINQGIGAVIGKLDLYFASDNPTSVQASSDPEILKTIAKSNNLSRVEIDVTTLDAYCEMNSISHINLLKIDTEGFELEALTGAKSLLAAGAIQCIQFEFNEVNIVKRRFLKDFYNQLPGFEFYRLDEKRLIPLKEWQPIHEIFMFQNIVALKK